MHTIAHILTDFNTKFGIPRQSGLVESLRGTIVFTPPYRNADALRGLEGFSHLWIIWDFSEAHRPEWSPTVRPPRLGGNRRMGVFATRSPFRPNALGLSSVRISRIETDTTRGPVITVVGADLMDGTPIYDIKPYIPYADSHPEAKGGFTDTHAICRLTVVIPDCFHHLFSQSQLQALYKVLELDPRPHYHKSGQKEYGMPYMDYDVHFTVNDGVLTVTDVIK